ncbi:ParB/RepB/Spo0J family partition protein [Micromonospora sp. RB23]
MEDLPLERLEISARQARTRAVDEGLDDLVESIRVNNQLEPIVVAPIDGTADRYEIIIGQRRFLAHQRLNRRTINAAILERAVDEISAKVLSLSENLIRRNMNQLDLIDVCTLLYHKYGSMKAAADELGLPYHQVRSYVKYERLDPELKTLVDQGDIDVKTALRVEDAVKDVARERVDLKAIASQLAGLTRAEQIHRLRSMKQLKGNPRTGLHPIGVPARGAEGVRQVVVTLPAADHRQMRAWARNKGMTQDQAAAQIIGSFLSRQRDRSGVDFI